jgi:hypothetical protein
MILGSSWEKTPYAMPTELARIFAAMCSRMEIRAFVQWNVANPKPGVYNTDDLDLTVSRCLSAGLKPWINTYFAPPWATDGKRIYDGYSSDCSHSNIPWDGGVHKPIDRGDGFCGWVNSVSGAKCTQTAPSFCERDIPKIDSAATYSWGRYLGKRYGTKVKTFAAGNEFGQTCYFLPQVFDGGVPVGPDVSRIIDEVIDPFTQGVRREVPDAKFRCPEADTSGWTVGLFRAEKDAKKRWCDEFTCHPYDWGGSPDPVVNSVSRLDDFILQFEPFRAGRPILVSEIGFNVPTDLIRFVDQAEKRGVTLVSTHAVGMYFKPGTIREATDGLPVDGKTGYVTNELYAAMKQRFTVPKRRRGVRS